MLSLLYIIESAVKSYLFSDQDEAFHQISGFYYWLKVNLIWKHENCWKYVLIFQWKTD